MRETTNNIGGLTVAIDKTKLVEAIDPDIAAEIKDAVIERNDDLLKITITTVVVIEGRSRKVVEDAAKLLNKQMYVSKNGVVCETIQEAMTADGDP